jgi:hypothetical protein
MKPTADRSRRRRLAARGDGTWDFPLRGGCVVGLSWPTIGGGDESTTRVSFSCELPAVASRLLEPATTPRTASARTTTAGTLPVRQHRPGRREIGIWRRTSQQFSLSPFGWPASRSARLTSASCDRRRSVRLDERDVVANEDDGAAVTRDRGRRTARTIASTAPAFSQARGGRFG